MTDDSDRQEYFGNRIEQIEEWLSAGVSPDEVESRTRRMTQRDGIDCTSEQLQLIVNDAMRRVWPINLTVNNYTITDSPNASITTAPQTPPAPSQVAPEEKPEARIVSVEFIRLGDARLNTLDRIVLSFLWKWTRRNRKRKRSWNPSLLTIQRVTGARASTAAECVSKLRNAGYLNEHFQVLAKSRMRTVVTKKGTEERPTPFPIFQNGTKTLGYTKCKFRNDGRIRKTLAHCVLASLKSKQLTPAYVKCVLGCSLRSAHNYLAE